MMKAEHLGPGQFAALKAEAEENNARPLYYVGSDGVTVFQRPTATIDEIDESITYAMGFSLCEVHPGIDAHEFVRTLLRADQISDYLVDLEALAQMAGALLMNLDDGSGIVIEGVKDVLPIQIKDFASGIHATALHSEVAEYLRDILRAYHASGRVERLRKTGPFDPDKT